jgi:hypothetical protein
MEPDVASANGEFNAALTRFHRDFPRPVGFVVMRFGDTPEHRAVLAALADVSQRTGVPLLRADHHRYHPQLFDNVCVYLHGCAFAISVFEDAESRGYNPNVALEVGYLQALKKPVLHLKSTSLPRMPTDLQGMPCCHYDPAQIDETVRSNIARWMLRQQPRTSAAILPFPIAELRPRTGWRPRFGAALRRI